MIGSGFIIRALQIIVYIVMGGALIVGFSALAVYGSRAIWSAFDIMLHDQAEWMITRFSFLKPWRACTIPVVSIVCVLCFLIVMAYAYISGQGPVEVIP